jgi:hypothetical protein
VEIPDEGPSRKRIGRPPLVGRFHEGMNPTHFCKILMAPGIGVLPLVDGFRPYICPVPGKMIIKITTGCQWEMNVKEVSGKAVLEAGWARIRGRAQPQDRLPLVLQEAHRKGVQGGRL